MSSSILLILVFHHHFIATVISPAVANQILWAHECSDENGNYTSNSTYKSNLDKALAKISTTDIPYGFYNLSAGHAPDQANAIALCRGDINITECHTCLDFLISNHTDYCPNQKEGIGWAEKCMLRYSSRSILDGVWEEDPYYNLVTGTDYDTHDVGHFAKVVNDLLSTLPNKTAGGDSRLKFATGEAHVSTSQTVYALMQCTPDLSPNDCLGCLYWAMYYALNVDRGQVGARVLLPSCSVRYDSQKFYLSPPPGPPPPRAASGLPSSVGSEGSGRSKIVLVLVVVIVALGVLACLSLLVTFFVCCLKQRTTRSKMLPSLNGAEEASRLESFQMDFNVMKDATQNFSEANQLGRGGFGIVYKGALVSGEQIAVKRLGSRSRQSDNDFLNEVRLTAKLQHRNLVKLLGFCLKGDERLLIFEFVSNGSLDKVLFDEEKRVQLDWGKRFIIIEGIARGLLYLHEDSRYKIVHCDLKAANVLLDEDMRPKISDFGTSRLFLTNMTHDVTERAAGTRAYMAPEYLRQGLFSFKSDVYSFGILVLEIVAGRRTIIPSVTSDETCETLVNLAWRNWIEGTIPNIIDPTILSTVSMSQVTRCIHIAFLCVQESADSRPTMYSVNQMLAGQSSELPYPSQLAFVLNQSKPLLDATDALIQSKSIVSLGSSTDLYPR